MRRQESRNRSLYAAELLHLWEQGRALAPAQRGVLLLVAACPGCDQDGLMKLSAGERDAILLDLREKIFGPGIWAQARCPVCSEQVEARFATTDIRLELSPRPSEDLFASDAGLSLRFRLPDGLDLLSISALQDRDAAYEQLLKRCTIEIRSRDGGEVPEQLPPEAIRAMVASMEKADPQGDIEVALSCPSCGHEWLVIFDIISFLWSEIESFAHRALREVHSLATAYGWREADILDMSPQRRQIYLEMIGG